MTIEHQTTDHPTNSTDYTIVYDTLCGWSYGAAEVMTAIVDSGASVRLLHRHLFQGDNAPVLADSYVGPMTEADQRIEQLTGAEFSADYATNVRGSATEVLDSGLTADAAALLHEQGASTELAFSRHLQRRRFVDGVSAQDRDDLVEALVAFGVDRAEAELVGSAELRDRANKVSTDATAAMTAAEAVGVPAVIAHGTEGDHLVDLARFYREPASAVATLNESRTS